MYFIEMIVFTNFLKIIIQRGCVGCFEAKVFELVNPFIKMKLLGLN